MTKELKERIYGFTATHDMNQVCAIFMVSRPVVEAIIAEMEAPATKKSTKKETPKLDIDPMFEEEPGL
jgi:hypothetical protein